MKPSVFYFLLYTKLAFAAVTEYVTSTFDSVTGGTQLVRIFDDGSTEIVSNPSFPTTLLSSSIAVTNDHSSNLMYFITGFTSGTQELVSVCDNTVTSIPISPSRVNLRCLSSGPGGIYARNRRSKNIGKIDVNTGVWSPIARLPGPRNQIILAQDDEGRVNYINGAGEYYLNPGTEDKMTLVEGTTFPINRLGFCGEIDDPNHIVAISFVSDPTFNEERGIQRYNIGNTNLKRQDTIPGITGFDITTGDIPVCATPNPTLSPTSSPTSAPSTSEKGKKGKKGKKDEGGEEGKKGKKGDTDAPTLSPTLSPTSSPTTSPTSSPTSKPTASPSDAPTSLSSGSISGSVSVSVSSSASGSISGSTGASVSAT